MTRFRLFLAAAVWLGDLISKFIEVFMCNNDEMLEGLWNVPGNIRSDTAYHEAGHLGFAWIIGCEKGLSSIVDYIEIGDEPNEEGVIEGGVSIPDDAREQFSGIEWAVICLGGWYGQTHLTKDFPTSSDELQKVFKDLAYDNSVYHHDIFDLEARMPSCEQEYDSFWDLVYQQMQKHQEDVRKVICAIVPRLLEAGRLDVDTVREILAENA